jgi:iron complex transport system substrate-binding protein
MAADIARADVSVVDDEGRQITLARPATRVIALYAALSDIVCALGKQDALVARTQSQTEPPSLAAKPCIGTHMRPSVEMTVALKPELVLQMGSRAKTNEAVAAIERVGIPVALFHADNFDSLYSVIERVGVLLGATPQATALVRDMQARLNRVAQRVQSLPRPSVFYEIRYPNLLAAGQNSLVSEIIQLAGGVNCVRSQRKLVRVSEEELLRLAPQVYMLQRGPMNPDPVPVKDRPHFRQLAAVKNGRVYEVLEKLFSRPGPGSALAVEKLAGLLHPETKNKEARP